MVDQKIMSEFMSSPPHMRKAMILKNPDKEFILRLLRKNCNISGLDSLDIKIRTNIQRIDITSSSSDSIFELTRFLSSRIVSIKNARMDGIDIELVSFLSKIL